MGTEPETVMTKDDSVYEKAEMGKKVETDEERWARLDSAAHMSTYLVHNGEFARALSLEGEPSSQTCT